MQEELAVAAQEEIDDCCVSAMRIPKQDVAFFEFKKIELASRAETTILNPCGCLDLFSRKGVDESKASR